MVRGNHFFISILLAFVLQETFLQTIKRENINRGGERFGNFKAYEDENVYEPPARYYKSLNNGASPQADKGTMIYGHGKEKPLGAHMLERGNATYKRPLKTSVKTKRYDLPLQGNWKPMHLLQPPSMDSSRRYNFQTGDYMARTPLRKSREYTVDYDYYYGRRPRGHYDRKYEDDLPGRYYSGEDYEDDYYSSEEEVGYSPERYDEYEKRPHWDYEPNSFKSDRESGEEYSDPTSYEDRRNFRLPSRPSNHDYTSQTHRESLNLKSSLPVNNLPKLPLKTEEVMKSTMVREKGEPKNRNSHSSVQFSTLRPTTAGLSQTTAPTTTASTTTGQKPARCQLLKKKFPTQMNPNNEVTCYTCQDSTTGKSYQQCSYGSEPTPQARTGEERQAEAKQHRRWVRAAATSRYRRSYRFGPKDFDSDITELQVAAGETCKKFTRNDSLCIVCQNPATGSDYEQCSYESGMRVKTIGKEKTNNEFAPLKGVVRPETRERPFNHSSAEQDLKEEGGNSRVSSRPKVSVDEPFRGRRYEAISKSGMPLQDAAQDEYQPDSHDEEETEMFSPNTDSVIPGGSLYKNYEDYFYSVFPGLSHRGANSFIYPSYRGVFIYPFYEGRSQSDYSSFEKAEESMSDCKKFTKGKMTTCYLCEDEGGSRSEECFTGDKRISKHEKPLYRRGGPQKYFGAPQLPKSRNRKYGDESESSMSVEIPTDDETATKRH